MKTIPIIFVLANIISIVFGRDADANYDYDPIAEAQYVEEKKHREWELTPCPKGDECEWINEQRCDSHEYGGSMSECRNKCWRKTKCAYDAKCEDSPFPHCVFRKVTDGATIMAIQPTGKFHEWDGDEVQGEGWDSTDWGPLNAFPYID